MKSPFPQDWKEYTIGDCLRRVEHPVEVDSDALYTQIGIRSHGKGLFYKEPVTGELLGSKAVYWVEPNCFILNIVFAWEQAIGKTTQAEVGMIGSHRFPMYKPVNNLIDIDYLVYYLLTKRGTDILEAASPGGAGRNRTLGQDRFMKSRIVLPPLDEQQKIAEILATQDKAIELQGRKIEELKRFKKGCLEKMFPRKGQKVPEKRFPGFTDDWEQRKLEDYLTVSAEKNTGNIYGRSDVLSVSGDYGIVNQIEFQGRSFAGASVSNYGVVQTGDVVYTKSPLNSNPYGIIKTNKGKPGIVSTLYAVYHPKENAFSDFIQVYFEQHARMNNYMHPLVNKGAKNDMKVSAENALKGPVCFPSRIEQKSISAFFSVLDNLITLHQRKLEEMKKQKKALMQLLLTGIVRI